MPPQPKPTMENRRQKSSSGETFSFPNTPVHDQDSEDFEFGCFTPDSASSDPCKDSPADHLFCNGKLLPHAFPFQPNNNGMLLVVDHSRRTSRTSSISSKDSLSLMSSRSNSTNSRSSTSSCSSSSSARTSSSDNSERKLMYHHHYSRTTPFRSSERYKTGGGAPLYGSSQRWQFITPVPTLSRDTSIKKKVDIAAAGKGKPNKAKKKRKVKTVVVRRRRLCRKFFRWLVSACIKCHAMEPSKKSDVVDHVKDGNHVKLQ